MCRKWGTALLQDKVNHINILIILGPTLVCKIYPYRHFENAECRNISDPRNASFTLFSLHFMKKFSKYTMPGESANGNVCDDSKNWKPEDIVISGIAGRFPESHNMRHFQENLFNKLDLITDDVRRWQLGEF